MLDDNSDLEPGMVFQFSGDFEADYEFMKILDIEEDSVVLYFDEPENESRASRERFTQMFPSWDLIATGTKVR